MITAPELAKSLGKAKSTVTRKAAELGVGKLDGRTLVFTVAEEKRLRAAIREKRGCPMFVDGNQFWRNRKYAAK